MNSLTRVMIFLLAFPMIENEKAIQRYVVIRGSDISLSCTIPTSTSEEGPLRVYNSDLPRSSKTNFTWYFKGAESSEVIADDKCRVKRNDLYKVIHTKGASCHLWIYEASLDNVGVYESAACGKFGVSLIDSKPSCQQTLLSDNSSIFGLYERIKPIFLAKKECGILNVEDDVADHYDDNKTNTTTATPTSDDNIDDLVRRKELYNYGDDINPDAIPISSYSGNEMLKILYSNMVGDTNHSIEIYEINCSIDYRSYENRDTPTLFWSPTPTLISVQFDTDDQHVIRGHVIIPSTSGVKMSHVCKVLAPNNDNNLGMLGGNCRIDIYGDSFIVGENMRITKDEDICHELWQYAILGFIFTSIMISIGVTVSSRVRKSTATSGSLEYDSRVDKRKSTIVVEPKSHRKTLTSLTMPETARLALTSIPSVLYKGWTFKSPTVDTSQSSPQLDVNFKKLMKNLKSSMKHLPPSGSGMMAEHGVLDKDDLSWYFANDHPNNRDR